MKPQASLALEAGALGSSLLGQNHKLHGTSLVECPEIEGAAACVYMHGSDKSQTPLCPGCYAAKLGKVRRSRWSGRRTTPAQGLIRLGTWKEILEHEYDAFVRGEGRRPDDGSSWKREDFARGRFHFVISRGLLPLRVYRDKMAANPWCLNVQISVDVIRVRNGSTIIVPPEAKLADLAQLPKVLFRYKTLAQPTTCKGVSYEPNVTEFSALTQRLGLDRMRVLETPLRLGGNRAYGMTTPLEEAGWASASFLRCNSACSACPSSRNRAGENRVLGCAVTPRIVQLLREKGNEANPARRPMGSTARFAWTELTLASWRRLGGTASLQDLYAGVRASNPSVEANGHWKAKVREVVQRHGTRVGPALWKFHDTGLAPVSPAMGS